MPMTREEAITRIKNLYDHFKNARAKQEGQGIKFQYKLDDAHFNKMIRDENEINRYIRANEFKKELEAKEALFVQLKKEHGFNADNHPIGRNMPFFLKLDNSDKSKRHNQRLIEMFSGPGCIKIQERVRQEGIKYNTGDSLNKKSDIGYQFDKSIDEFSRQYCAYNKNKTFQKVPKDSIIWDKDNQKNKGNQKNNANKKNRPNNNVVEPIEQYTNTFKTAFDLDATVIEMAYDAQEIYKAYQTGLAFIFDINSPDYAGQLADEEQVNYTILLKPLFNPAKDAGKNPSLFSTQEDLDYMSAVSTMFLYRNYKQCTVQYNAALQKYKMKEFKDGSLFLNYKAYDISDKDNLKPVKLKDALENPDEKIYKIVERTELEKADLLNNMYSKAEKDDQEAQLKEFDRTIWKRVIEQSNLAKKLKDNSMFFSFMQSGKYTNLENSVKELIAAINNPQPGDDLKVLANNIMSDANDYIEYKQAKAITKGDPNLIKDSTGRGRLQWANELLNLMSNYNNLAQEYETVLDEMFVPPESKLTLTQEDRKEIQKNITGSKEKSSFVDVTHRPERNVSVEFNN